MGGEERRVGHKKHHIFVNTITKSSSKNHHKIQALTRGTLVLLLIMDQATFIAIAFALFIVIGSLMNLYVCCIPSHIPWRQKKYLQ